MTTDEKRVLDAAYFGTLGGVMTSYFLGLLPWDIVQRIVLAIVVGERLIAFALYFVARENHDANATECSSSTTTHSPFRVIRHKTNGIETLAHIEDTYCGFTFYPAVGRTVSVIYDPERQYAIKSIMEREIYPDDLVAYLREQYGWAVNNGMHDYVIMHAMWQELHAPSTTFKAYDEISSCTSKYISRPGIPVRELVDEVESCNPDAPRFETLPTTSRIGYVNVFYNSPSFVLRQKINDGDALSEFFTQNLANELAKLSK
jgi:hypothetical protein